MVHCEKHANTGNGRTPPKNEPRANFVNKALANHLIQFNFPPIFLDAAPLLLFLQPLELRRICRFRWTAIFGSNGGFADQDGEPVDCSLPIPVLTTKLTGGQDQNAVLRHFLSSEFGKPFINRSRKIRAVLGVEPDLDSRLYLVDILPAGARRPDEAFADLVVIEDDICGYPDHRLRLNIKMTVKAIFCSIHGASRRPCIDSGFP